MRLERTPTGNPVCYRCQTLHLHPTPWSGYLVVEICDECLTPIGDPIDIATALARNGA